MSIKEAFSRMKVTDKERMALEATLRGIDLETVFNAMDNLAELLKPLYEKNLAALGADQPAATNAPAHNINGTEWLCVDPVYPQGGLAGKILDSDTDPDHNGDGDVTIQYQDGSKFTTKYRKFLDAHQEIKREDLAKEEMAAAAEMLIGLDLAEGHAMDCPQCGIKSTSFTNGMCCICWDDRHREEA